MSKILLVDDDAVIVEIYRKKLAQEGFDVETAPDGLEAVKALHKAKPDLMVLDLMMPRFSGFEVLKYIRTQASLRDLRVVVLSNFYVGGEQHREVAAQANAALLKAQCRPATLVETINQVLTQAVTAPAAQPIAAPASAAPAPAAPQTAGPAAESPAPAPMETESETDAHARNRREFLKSAPTILATLRQLNDAFIGSDTPQTQDLRLLDFYRKVHFLTAMGGLAGCEAIAMLSSAFEALLFQLHEKPNHIKPSSIQTIAFTLEVLGLLVADAGRTRTPAPVSSKALVVDDDPLTTRVIAGALRAANLGATGASDAASALKALEQQHFDLVLLDMHLPDMAGLELCKKVRALPQYKKTPIIFVTGDTEFDKRLESVVSGGDDLIAKPVFPIELAVKAVTHLLKSQLSV